MSTYKNLNYFTTWDKAANGRKELRVMSCSGVHVASIIQFKLAAHFMAQLCSQEV